MLRRLVLSVTALGLAAASALALPVSSLGATPGDLTVHVPKVFSPNGDGRKDEARIRYELPRNGRVTVVVLQGIPSRTVKVAKLGWQKRGEHQWSWDGRGKGGRRVADGSYFVNVALTAADGTRITPARRARTRVDTTFSARVEARTDYALPRGKVLPVYPRTSVVRDSVSLRPLLHEKARWARLVIKDRRGRTVLSEDVTDADDLTYSNADYGQPHPDDVVWTARRRGKALPPGRYRAFVRGRDVAGNINRTDTYPLRVSREALEWREETRAVGAQGSRTAVCGFLSTANGCGEAPAECGVVVASALLAGGLSYRSAECDPARPERNTASALHYLPVPETAGIRGVAAARVSFAGRPTPEAGSDQGTLAVWREQRGAPQVTVSGSTGATTGWVDCPRGCRGIVVSEYDGRFDPGVVWSFTTRGTSSVDVATFTVEVRYLAVTD